MAELSTRDSFIVRIYRYDPEDSRRVTGLVEALDGSGANEPFTDTGQLGDIVNMFVRRRRKAREGKKETDDRDK
jgi:hypothetical protein